MYRISILNILPVFLIPVAILLSWFGFRRFKTSRKTGFALSVALVANTALLIIATPGNANGEDDRKMCYRTTVVPGDYSTTEANPTVSPYWSDLVNAVIDIEKSIYDFSYSPGFDRGNLKAAENAINLMKYDGVFGEETAQVLKVYVKERYIRAQEEVDCYDRATPTPDPAYKERDDILEQMYALASLRRGGKLSDSAYGATLTKLEKELADYIPESERPLVLKIIIDLVNEVREQEL